ncbi:DUF2470 domain-containing protein [Lentzea sp. NBC_00516]|nr:DUF2470 domain-containing protein [Lentzea sp. NBC_00516]WUD22706.1 DUF2470 domain-containing protein [Lentzea sp. NBC_00516]
MTDTQTKRPPAPHAAERARTIAARHGSAALLPQSGSRTSPLFHHVHPCGSTILLLSDEHPLVGQLWQTPRAEVTAMLEIADQAPVPLREPVRGLLWLTGWVTALDGEAARQEILAVADVRPDHRLLDAGHGASVLRLTPASMVIADAEGTSSIRPEQFASAAPDPFCGNEDHWLRHLEAAHSDVVDQLARHLPEELRTGHVRPLGLDRFGLRLRVETECDDHDVRIAFSKPVSTPQELAAELRRLMGCPFLSQR